MKKRETIHEWELLVKQNGDDLDVEKLTTLLDEYTVEFPPEHVIQSTIANCLIHVPQRAAGGNRSLMQIKQLFNNLLIQTEYLAKWFWLFSILLFLCGYLAALAGSINPYKTVFLLSPLPFVLGLLELLRNVDSGMTEIELSCKMSLPQMVMARFVLIGLYNIVLNSVISLGLYWTVGIDFWKVVLLWLVPFTWISSMMLFLASKFRGRKLVPIGVCAWGGAVVGGFSNPNVLPYLLSLNNSVFVLLAGVGCGLLWVQSKQLYHCVERGMFVEIAN